MSNVKVPWYLRCCCPVLQVRSCRCDCHQKTSRWKRDTGGREHMSTQVPLFYSSLKWARLLLGCQCGALAISRLPLLYCWSICQSNNHNARMKGALSSGPIVVLVMNLGGIEENVKWKLIQTFQRNCHNRTAEASRVDLSSLVDHSDSASCSDNPSRLSMLCNGAQISLNCKSFSKAKYQWAIQQLGAGLLIFSYTWT